MSGGGPSPFPAPAPRQPPEGGLRLPLIAAGLFAAVLLAAHAPALLDAGTVLDNTRQYGPPLVAERAGNAWLASQPQVAYFHDATPRLYRWLVDGIAALAGAPVVAVTKGLALALLLPLAVVVAGLGHTLLRRPGRSAAFAVLLAANAVFANQMLTGTPRDLGTVLFLAVLLALLRRRFGWALAALVPLAGVYPTFGLQALATLGAALALGGLPPLTEAVAAGGPPGVPRGRRALPPVGLAVGAAALGVKLLGPRIARATWGPTLRIFRPGGQEELAALRHAAGDDPLPSVANLIGFQVSPSHLFALLEDKRFRFLPPGGEHAFGWIGDPASILLAAALVLTARRAWRSCRDWRPHAWPIAVFAGLLLMSVTLYLLAFATAFSLHNPNRYGMMPTVLLLSGAELALLVGLAGWLPSAVCRRTGPVAPVLALALVLPLLRGPVDVVPVPAAALAAVGGNVPVATAQVLVVDPGGDRDLRALASALPLVEGVRVYYAEEMDRGFHRRALVDGLRLRHRSRELGDLAERGSPTLWQELERSDITHLLGEARPMAALAPSRCRRPIPGDLALVEAACAGAAAR